MNTENNYAATFYSETENDIEVLEKNVADYPSSSVARFLLLYHYKKNNDSRFEEFAIQSAVFLYDPLWSQYQLSRADKNGTIFPNKETILESEPVVTKANNENTSIENVIKEKEINIDKDQPFSAVNEEKPGNLIFEGPALEENKSIGETLDTESGITNEIETIRPENNDGISSEITNNNQEENVSVEEIPAPVNEQINENFILGIPSNDGNNNVPGNIESETSSFAEGLFVTDSNVEDKNETAVVVNEEVENSTEKNLSDNEDSAVKNQLVGANLHHDMGSGEEINDGEETEDDISFEPLHTVDYFASQGIKIPEEVLEDDKLGKQVKSFTAWLKTMKKLHPGQLPEQNEVIERIIQSASEASNQNANVLTEAMAEVLVKQGKREKAIEMYEKLSLLNPSKSAYFAAKIESLKIV